MGVEAVRGAAARISMFVCPCQDVPSKGTLKPQEDTPLRDARAGGGDSVDPATAPSAIGIDEPI